MILVERSASKGCRSGGTIGGVHISGYQVDNLIRAPFDNDECLAQYLTADNRHLPREVNASFVG